MKAAILVDQNQPLTVAEVEPPQLDVGQVLVEVHATGICGKQIEEITGRRGHDPYLPHLLGHEGAGVVEKVGSGVTTVEPGDHVVLHWMKGSGIDSPTPDFDCDGTHVDAGQITTFSERTVVSENRVTPIPEDVPKDVAALLGCAVTTGLGIVDNDIGLRPAESICVFGVGGVGLNVVQAAMLVSAHPVVAVDLFDHKLDRARKLGATHTVNADTGDVEATLRDIAGAEGFDATVDLTGQTDVRERAFRLTSDEGTTVFAGVPHHEDTITVDSFPLHFGRTVTGSHGGDTNPDVDIPRAIELYRQGLLELDSLITHRFPLDDINEAVATVRKGEAGRVMVLPQSGVTTIEEDR